MFLLHVTLIQTFHLCPRYEQNLLELITDFLVVFMCQVSRSLGFWRLSRTYESKSWQELGRGHRGGVEVDEWTAGVVGYQPLYHLVCDTT